MHYRYLTIEQRENLEKRIRAAARSESALKSGLERLHQPDYGVCIECRADIGYERLLADPAALHCRACGHLPTAPRATA